MIRNAGVLSILLALLSPIVTTPVAAQYGPTGPDALPNNYPPPLPDRRGPAPKLAFTVVGEILLPGPLGAAEAWTDGSAVYVSLASGVARIAPVLDAKPVSSSVTPPDPADRSWVVSPNGKKRYRTTTEGIVEAQHKTAVRKRWAHSWKIVAPNSIAAPPLLIGPRLCYAGLDDRVTCVRATNGDRLWSVDLGDRLSKDLAAWRAPDAATAKHRRGEHSIEGEVLLVVPDNGASIIALDAYAGTKLASYELPAAKNRFHSSPLVFPGGRIAVVRKGYAEDEAALTLLDLVRSEDAKPSPAVPYNPAITKPDVQSGR